MMKQIGKMMMLFALLVKGGSVTTIKGGKITSNATGALCRFLVI